MVIGIGIFQGVLMYTPIRNGQNVSGNSSVLVLSIASTLSGISAFLLTLLRGFRPFAVLASGNHCAIRLLYCGERAGIRASDLFDLF